MLTVFPGLCVEILCPRHPAGVQHFTPASLTFSSWNRKQAVALFKIHCQTYSQAFNFQSEGVKLSGFPLEAPSRYFLQLVSPPSGLAFKQGVQLNPKTQSKTQLEPLCFHLVTCQNLKTHAHSSQIINPSG